MVKDKDRALNPAAAHRKQEKQKALKKGKAAVAASRTARFATRNPSRLERQIADLKAIQESSGSLNARDKKQLEELERDIARIKKARIERPDLVPQRGDGGSRGAGVLGKRDRDGGRPHWGRDHHSSSETDEEVRNIPMPRDTPPPIPRPRPRNGGRRGNANNEPLGAGRESLQERQTQEPDLSLPSKPAVAAQTVYESAAQVRDLRKEATQRFMPSVVKQKLDASKGKGRLLEEDEIEKLENEGYGDTTQGHKTGDARTHIPGYPGLTLNAAPAVDELRDEQSRLEEEEERFAKEMAMADQAEAEQPTEEERSMPRGVLLEEVVDENL